MAKNIRVLKEPPQSNITVLWSVFKLGAYEIQNYLLTRHLTAQNKLWPLALVIGEIKISTMAENDTAQVSTEEAEVVIE